MPDLHESLRPLVQQITRAFEKLLRENLVGIYAHGSAVWGGFHPKVSDFDFLVVVREALDPSIKEALIPLSLRLAEGAPAKGLEYSVVLLRYTLEFNYPTPFEFHYGRDWHEAFLAGNAIRQMPPTDPDLAVHFTVTRARGMCIFGESIERVFGSVPERAYWSSLMVDADGIWADMATNPIYSILNLCRIAAYQQEKSILSKLEGGKWGLEHLPARFHPLIQQALSAYATGAQSPGQWENDLLAEFGQLLKQRLSR